MGTVRRLPSAVPLAEDTPAIRRIAPRNFSGIFMICLLCRRERPRSCEMITAWIRLKLEHAERSEQQRAPGQSAPNATDQQPYTPNGRLSIVSLQPLQKSEKANHPEHSSFKQVPARR